MNPLSGPGSGSSGPGNPAPGSRNGSALDPARAALLAAELAESPAERYLAAQLAALRVAAAILGTRAKSGGGGRPRNVWQVVGEVAPEFAEWAGFFAATQGKRQAVAAGATALVSHREADDLVRDAQAFHDAVGRRLSRSVERARGAG